MNRCFAIRLIIAVSFAFMSSMAEGAWPATIESGKDSVKTHNPKAAGMVMNQHKGTNAAGFKASFPQRKLQKVQKGIETAKKISAQRASVDKILADRPKAERRITAEGVMKAEKNNRAYILGKLSPFTKAPAPVYYKRSAKAKRVSLASPVLINGKQSDTLQVGEPYDLTFSFAPGFVSAVMNIYIDADGNGVLSDGDIKVSQDDILLLDNGSRDSDPSEGKYRLRLGGDYVFNYIASTMIFEINDYQSTATALVTLTQPSRLSVIRGSLVPAMPNIIVELYDGRSTVYVCTDSAGMFTGNIAMTPPYYLYAYLYDLSGVSNGYILPGEKRILVNDDTTSVSIELPAAAAFVEGTLRDYDGNPIVGSTVWADDNSYTYRSVQCKTDGTGHYDLGLASGTWLLSVSSDDSGDFMQGQTQLVLVPASGTVRVDMSVPRANSTISGKVTLSSAGVGGFPIYAVSSPFYNSVLTEADGTYSVPVFNTGEYNVSISLDDGGYYVDQNILYGKKPGAMNVDFSVKKVAGGISGKVTDSNTLKPIAGADIEVQNYSSYSYVTRVTDDSGYYRIPLVDGSYSITAFAKGHFYYYGYLTVNGQFVTLNISLQPSGMISGTIKDAGGLPIPGMYVSIYDAQYSNVGNNYSDYDGTYYVDGLNAGQYKAVAGGGNYISQWYNKKTDFDAATPVNVSIGHETAGIDFSLVEGGKISGRVADKQDSPVSGATVSVYDSLMYWWAYASADDSGKYIAGGLPTGNYYVEVWSPDFADRWYDGKLSYSLADKVPVVIGQETRNIDFKLIRASTISGRVTDKYSNPLTYAYLYALDTLLNSVGYAYTDYSGNYKFSSLNAGKYYVFAEASSYAKRWYDNAKSVESATLISLAEEEEKAGIDFMLPPGGSITGRVLDGGGNPLSTASIYSYERTGAETGYSWTDYQGYYTITGLSRDEYFVYAYAPQHIDQWYDHKPTYDQADIVRVQADSTTTNINFDLAAGSGVYGYIIDDSSGNGVYGLAVSAYDVKSRSIFYTTSDWDGSYSMSLPTGKYIVEAFEPGIPTTYLPYFYTASGSASLPSKAEIVNIVAGQTGTGLNFRLKRMNPTCPLNKSNLKLTITNSGQLGTGDSAVSSGRWPSNASANYLYEGDLVIGISNPGFSPYVFGGLHGNMNHGWEWDPIWNFTARTISDTQTVETAFLGGFDYYYCLPELTVQQDCYSVSNTDYVIIAYRILYNGVSYGMSHPISDVYVGQFFDFDVSPSRDLVGRFVSDTLVYVYDSTNRDGVNIGARLLSGKPARIGWWRAADDPVSNTDLYDAMKSDTTTTVPGIGADQRVFLSSGPYSLDVGDTVTFAVAIVAGNGANAALSASRAAAEKYPQLTSVKDKRSTTAVLPTKFELRQNYPNPFNPSTTISFDLPARTHVKLCVYNVLGQLVTTLVDEEKPAGQYSVLWNAGSLASGVYFYRIESKSFTRTTKMVLMK